MKFKLLLFSLLLFTKVSYSQSVNYCNYFSFKVEQEMVDGELKKYSKPVYLEDNKSTFGKFLKRHNNRFVYIMFKYFDDYKFLSKSYPDTNFIKNQFCENFIQNNKIQKYFKALTPKSLTKWDAHKDTFTTDELMLTASKFFYCNDIIKKDTSIQSHICVGINGQKEYKYDKDVLLLEAFCFEAIFYYLQQNDEPKFYSEFAKYVDNISKENRNNFKDFESYLLEIRNLCYDKMKQNQDLKKKLLKYYQSNKANLNFEIKK